MTAPDAGGQLPASLSSSQQNGSRIRLDAISKAWGDTTALNAVSLDIEAGSFTALLGPSGCGKSTALRIVSGLEEATSGRVIIGEEDVTGKPPAARDIAMVFQSYALFPHLSVAENIVFGLRVRSMARAEREEKLRYAAALLGLSDLLDRKPSQLSGGQQQRVALGRAIVADKSIFLMDEPLSNLDAKLRAEMRDEIRSLQQRLGVTMLYVTHDQVEAVTMADQVVLMNHGQVEQVGPPREIYAQPQSLFAAKFIGTPPMGTFSATAFAPHLSDVAMAACSDVTFGLRPEAVWPSDQGVIEGTVGHVEYLGADAMLECRTGEETVLCRAPGQTPVIPGAAIALDFEPGDLHAFSTETGRRLPALPPEIEQLLAAQKPRS